MHTYNTSKDRLVLRSYSRHVHLLVEYVKNIPDKAERTARVRGLMVLMQMINALSGSGSNVENPQKVWDDICIMANFELDVDSPYPIPEKNLLQKKPEKISYNKQTALHKRYGRHVLSLVQVALSSPDPEKQEHMLLSVARLISDMALGNHDPKSVVDYFATTGGKRLLADTKRIEEEMRQWSNGTQMPRHEASGRV